MKILKTIILEDATSDSEHALRELVRNNPEYMRYATRLHQVAYVRAKDRSKLLQTDDPAQFFVYSVKHDISSLHKKELGKYVYGVGRMAITGEMSNSDDILHINQILEMLATNEQLRKQYNKDFNGLSLDELYEQLDSHLEEYNIKMKEESGEDYERNENYMIEKVNSFDELAPLGSLCDWCIVDNEDSYDQYITDLGNTLFLIYDTNFMRYDRNDPEYKDSLIALIVDENLNMVCSTSRLNHDIKTGDRTYTYKELSQIIGANVVKEIQKLM